MRRADKVLWQIENASAKNFLPIIGPYEGKILSEEERKAKPLYVLEVGELIGYSAILMGNELDKKAEIISIEIHGGEAELAGQNIVRSYWMGKFDFVTIDAEKSQYYQYLKLVEASGGWVKLFLRITLEPSQTRWAIAWITFGILESERAAKFRLAKMA